MPKIGQKYGTGFSAKVKISVISKKTDGLYIVVLTLSTTPYIVLLEKPYAFSER